MTAEIAILNNMGVALAADSAVTIGDSRNRKVYHTVNKLFGLSRHHPVGLMIYGAADLLAVPWETTIKYFRSQLRDTTFPTLGEYADRFIDFMEGECGTLLFPGPAQTAATSAIIVDLYALLRRRVGRDINRAADKEGNLDEETLTKLIDDAVASMTEPVRAAGFLAGRSDEDAESIRARYEQVISKAFERSFKELPVSATAREQMRTLVGWRFTKSTPSAPGLSGLVIAGYGDKEIFPQLLSYRIYGYENGRLLYEKDEEESTAISYENRAAIVAFAQKEMVTVFMQGLHAEHAQFVLRSLHEIVVTKLPAVIESLAKDVNLDTTALLDALGKVTPGLVTQFQDDLSEFIQEHSVDPVIEMVQHLPKDELALMAESLVNLTSLKRRISMGAETVGGPVDVAVISKGDGFVWTRRKHYFPANLNPHFLAGYYRDPPITPGEEHADAQHHAHPPAAGRNPEGAENC